MSETETFVTEALAERVDTGESALAALTTFPAPGFATELGAVSTVDGAEPLDELLDGLPSVAGPVEALVCWPRLEDLWLGLPEPGRGTGEHRAAALEFVEAALDAARLRDCVLVFVLPVIPAERPLGIGDAGTVTGVVATATAVREALRARLAGQRDAHLVDADEDVRALGVERSHDHEGRYHPELLRAVAARSARLIELVRGPRPRALVVEADGVLWPGTIAELGPAAVASTAAVRRLSQLRDAGIAVVVCADAPADALDAALGAVLGRVTGSRARPLTGELLAELTEELDIRREELVVLRAEPGGPAGWTVLAMRPGEPLLPDLLPPHRQVRPPRLAEPLDERAVAALGIRVGFPDPGTIAAEIQPLRTAGHALEINDWQAGPAEFAVLAEDRDHLVVVAGLTDADGDHGPVGLAVARITDGSAELLAFRVAAPAAGRMVEQALLAELVDRAARRGAGSVHAAVRDLGTNGPALRFFAGLGVPARPQPQPLPPCTWPTGVAREEPRDD